MPIARKRITSKLPLWMYHNMMTQWISCFLRNQRADIQSSGALQCQNPFLQAKSLYHITDFDTDLMKVALLSLRSTIWPNDTQSSLQNVNTGICEPTLHQQIDRVSVEVLLQSWSLVTQQQSTALSYSELLCNYCPVHFLSPYSGHFMPPGLIALTVSRLLVGPQYFFLCL